MEGAEAAAGEQPGWIAGLTPLRGVAALLVVLYHAPLFGVGFSAYSVTYFFYQGWLWVDFFFVLSGFVMAHAYGARFTREIRGADLRDFLVSRFARLWPLHAAMLLVLVLLDVAKLGLPLEYSTLVPPAFTGRDDPALIPAELLFLHSFTPDDAWNVPSWSIAAEWWAYLLFPLLFIGVLRLKRTGRAVFFLGCYLALIAVWAATPRGLNVGNGTLVLVRCIAEFAFGIGVHALWRRGWGARLFGSDAVFLGLAAAIALALHFGVWDFLVVPLMAGLVLAGATNRARVGAALERKPMRWLGEISYSLYLAHWPVLVALALAVATLHGTPVGRTPSKLEALALLPVALALTLALAALTYRWIEVPARRWLKRRLAAPLRAPAAAE